MDKNGLLEYVQRKDWMVKVRGFRVEPGEVEQAIMRLAPVEQAVVKGFTNAAGETSLFAVYTAQKPVFPQQVTDAIRGFLPDYMLPAFLEQVEKLPLNQNGKVDRKNIMPPEAAKFTAVYKAPETEPEKLICAAFEKVLAVDRAGVLDDFNLLGGDSISAARLQEELAGLGISASDILSLGTPQKLAALRGNTLTAAAWRDAWPLTFAERQMATEQGMAPESVAYNINFLALRISGTLDAERLQRALDALAARHAILRSYYPLEKGEYTHRIMENERFFVPIERVSCATADAERIIEESNLPFDIGKAPLFRCHLLEHENGEYTLHFCFHHIIMDAASWKTFEGELFRLYRGETLPPLELQYVDYAVWQEEHAQLKTGEAVFRGMFADGVPETDMPARAARPDVLPCADVGIVRTIPAAEVKKTAQKFGVTQYGLLMAALGITLAKYCGTEDVVVGTAMSGRTMEEQKNMIGMFVNTLPVRMKPAGGMTAAGYVQETAQTIRSIKANQTYPFERLVPILAPDRNASRSPVFDVIFNYLQEQPVPKIEGATTYYIPVNRQALAIDLMLEATHEGEDIRLVLSYSHELYEDEIVENFMEQYLTVIGRLAEGSGQEAVMDIAELPERQRSKILDDFAGQRTDAYLGKTVVGLFRKQAALTPQKRAVVFKNDSLSYEELDDITDRIAYCLAEKGAGRGGVVGVMVRRGLMMPVARSRY
jgi:hypothetical protein